MRTSAPRAFAASRLASFPGTRSMSPKEQRITSGSRAIATARSMVSAGVTQTGQPGPCSKAHAFGKNPVDPMADDRVRLPAADLHHRPGPRGDPRNRVRKRAREHRIAEFIDIFHEIASGSISAR